MHTRQALTFIEDGTALYERYADGTPGASHLIEAKRVRASDVLPAIIPERALPPGCRFHFAVGNTTIFVTEEAPRVRTLAVSIAPTAYGSLAELMERRHEDDDADDEDVRPFTVALPYVVKVFAVRNIGAKEWLLNELAIFYRKKPLRTLDDMLYATNLLNVSMDGIVCLGYEEHSGTSPEDVVEDVEAALWGSTWNDDGPSSREYYEDHGRLGSPWEWERASRKDPTFILRARLCEAHTLREVIASALDDRIVSNSDLVHVSQLLANARRSLEIPPPAQMPSWR